MTTDEKYMRRCLELGQLGCYYVAPNPMVGAVLVSRDGRILAEGWHQAYGGPHAEVNCFAEADALGVSEAAIHEATLYVSLEPCSHYGKTPPCSELIIRKHPARVVAGMADPNPQVSGRGLRMIADAGIDVTCGVLEHECRELNKRFLCLMEKKRPYVILKWAETADGYVDNREPLPDPPLKGREIDGNGDTGKGEPFRENSGPLIISSPFTKQLVHKMRAENMAILVGANTVKMDHPRLKTTHWAGRDPLRIALDHHPEGKDYDGWLVYSEQTDWPYVLQDLASRGVHSILVEGGPTVLNHIIATGIYDEVHVERSNFRSKGIRSEGVKTILGEEDGRSEGVKTIVNNNKKGVKAPKWPFDPALAKNLYIEKYEESTTYCYTAGA